MISKRMVLVVGRRGVGKVKSHKTICARIGQFNGVMLYPTRTIVGNSSKLKLSTYALHGVFSSGWSACLP